MSQYILLVLSTSRHSTEGLHWAMHQAKEKKATLKVVYVGNGNPDQDSLALAAIEKQARTFQVPFVTQMEKGSYAAICEKFANGGDVEVLVAVDQKRNRFNKFFNASDLGKIQDRISSEIKVYPAS